MRAKSLVIVLIFLGSILSGCTGSDTEKDERIEALELELADSISDNNDDQAKIVTLESALDDAIDNIASLEESLNSLTISLSEVAESQRAELILQREEIRIQLNESEDNRSSLVSEISILDQNIQDLDGQIEAINLELQQNQNHISQLEDTVITLQNTMDSLIYSIAYSAENCPMDNPGSKMNIGYDNGEGLGVSGDGIITFDEIQHVVGECPWHFTNFGRVYNETTEEHDWGPQRTVIMGESSTFWLMMGYMTGSFGGVMGLFLGHTS